MNTENNNNETPKFNRVQEIKRRLYALRNGIVADSLRKGGLDYKMAFGLNLPQIVEVASEIEPDRELAETFWADDRTRESKLLAPMIYPREAVTRQRASEMLRQTLTTEVADVLCHRLLRHLPFAMEVAADAVADADELVRYGGFRLMFNLLYARPSEVRPFVEAELNSGAGRLTCQLCQTMLDELDFLAQP